MYLRDPVKMDQQKPVIVDLDTFYCHTGDKTPLSEYAEKRELRVRPGAHELIDEAEIAGYQVLFVCFKMGLSLMKM